MAGKPKQGLDYAGWATNIFDGDTKIDRLLDAQGWIGFSVYFYLCQMAYKFDGYFYRWSYADSASPARRMGGGVKSGTVEETVRYCLQIGLFDQRLFDEWNILTSRGIQKRFFAVIKDKRRRAVITDYWLLKEDEKSEGLEKCADLEHDCGKDGDICSKDGEKRCKDSPEEKKRKRKKKIPPLPPVGAARRPDYGTRIRATAPMALGAKSLMQSSSKVSITAAPIRARLQARAWRAFRRLWRKKSRTGCNTRGSGGKITSPWA